MYWRCPRSGNYCSPQYPVIPVPRIAVESTKVLPDNITKSIRNKPNLDDRFDTLYELFGHTKKAKADILLLPECFMPIEFLERFVWFAVKEQKLLVTGLEHVTVNKTSLNFIVTILPFEREGVKDAVVVYRLKNHYSHAEKLLIQTNHYQVLVLTQTRYDLFMWRGIYFSAYYCFELAKVAERSLFKRQSGLVDRL